MRASRRAGTPNNSPIGRRIPAPPNDDVGVSGEHEGPPGGGAPALLAVYDDALPAVYGYLLRRCSDRRVAEDLTSETFLAAMDTVRRDDDARPSTPWLIGVARHKLADHWRSMQRTPEPVDELPESVDDEWDMHLDRMLAHYTLARLSPTHRAALTLRYVDDLTVGDCATVLDRTVGATEALLTRAKRAFRAAYPESETRTGHTDSGRGGHA